MYLFLGFLFFLLLFLQLPFTVRPFVEFRPFLAQRRFFVPFQSKGKNEINCFFFPNPDCDLPFFVLFPFFVSDWFDLIGYEHFVQLLRP